MYVESFVDVFSALKGTFTLTLYVLSVFLDSQWLSFGLFFMDMFYILVVMMWSEKSNKDTSNKNATS